MKKIIAFIIALSVSLFTVGCYSLQSVDKNEEQTIRHQECEILKMNGEVINHPQWQTDSVLISSSSVIVFKKDSTIASYPQESIKRLFVDKINWPRTIIISTIGLIIVTPIILFVSNPPRFGG